MNRMRVAIVEDEKPAARLLYNMIKELRPDWTVDILNGSIDSACGWFDVNPHPDLLFLDIHLSDGNSFLFLERSRPKSAIIFTTAYDEYAVRAFTVNSIDYILKPIRKERLETAIKKYEGLVGLRATGVNPFPDLSEILRSISKKEEKKYRSRFLIYAADKMVTLNVRDIAFFYSDNKVAVAVTFDSREYALDLSLDRIMSQLDPDVFFRINRQMVISIDAIIRIEPYHSGKLVVSTKPKYREKVLVSKEKAAAFKIWLNF